MTQTNEDIFTSLPEKFRDAETGEANIPALISSYRELEKKLSGMAPKPIVPATPEEYCIDCSHGLFSVDPDVNKKLHEHGFTAEQVQMVYDLAAEKLIPAILEMTQEFQADREVEKLVSAFGGPEKWAEMSRQLLAYGQKNLPPQVLDNLSSSFEGVMALHRMMKGQEPRLHPSQPAANASETDLQAMMRDPRYWRDRDPAFVARVTEGFQKVYGGQQ